MLPTRKEFVLTRARMTADEYRTALDGLASRVAALQAEHPNRLYEVVRTPGGLGVTVVVREAPSQDVIVGYLFVRALRGALSRIPRSLLRNGTAA